MSSESPDSGFVCDETRSSGTRTGFTRQPSVGSQWSTSSDGSSSCPSDSSTTSRRRHFPKHLLRSLLRTPQDQMTTLTCDGDVVDSRPSSPRPLRIYAPEINDSVHYKSVWANVHSPAIDVIREALVRYGVDENEAGEYELQEVVGKMEHDSVKVSGDAPEHTETKSWLPFCSRTLSPSERPLLLMTMWQPAEGCRRRLELKHRPANHPGQRIGTSGEGMESLGRIDRTWQTEDSSFGGQRPRTGFETELGGEQENEEPHDLHNRLRNGTRKTNSLVTLPPAQLKEAHLILLQGFDPQKDAMLHFPSRHCPVVGPNGSPVYGALQLWASDILPRHCLLKLTDEEVNERTFSTLVLHPMPDAQVLVNGLQVQPGVQTVVRPGDLLAFGQHYIFLFKDAGGEGSLSSADLTHISDNVFRTEAKNDPRTTTLNWNEQRAGGLLHPYLKPRDWTLKSLSEQPLVPYNPMFEDLLLQKIVGLVGTGHSPGDDSVLPARLICLLMRHASDSSTPRGLRGFVLKVSNLLQAVAWEQTRELRDAQRKVEITLEQRSSSSCAKFLQPATIWLGNVAEVMSFLHSEGPALATGNAEEVQTQDDQKGYSATMAIQEAASLLEEVVLYLFQQTALYVCKLLLQALPELLDGGSEVEQGDETVVEHEVHENERETLAILKGVWSALEYGGVPSELRVQMLNHILSFANAVLFNSIMERGPEEGFEYKPGLQQELSSIGTWTSIRQQLEDLHPAQLHALLTYYKLPLSVKRPSAWLPIADEQIQALSTVDILVGLGDHTMNLKSLKDQQCSEALKTPSNNLICAARGLHRFLERLQELMDDPLKTEELGMVSKTPGRESRVSWRGQRQDDCVPSSLCMCLEKPFQRFGRFPSVQHSSRSSFQPHRGQHGRDQGRPSASSDLSLSYEEDKEQKRLPSGRI
uniref:ras-associating and dilute domain-containing protein-like isoform X2 n=1 Tax=Myxine glutinosa TaxID=7769 RepID=UPI00358E8757